MEQEVITLRDPNRTRFNKQEKIYREGIELEKGVVISEPWLKKNEELLYDCWCLFSAYPDIYLDMIKPTDSNFDLFPY